MSHAKRTKIIGLRAIRKSSHFGGKFLNRVEDRTNRVILHVAGSESGRSSVRIEDFMHKHFPFLAPIHPALPTIGQRPSVTVFTPSLSNRGFYGGIATLLTASAALAKKLDYDYRVVQTSGHEKNPQIIKFLKGQGIDFPPERLHLFDASYRNPGEFAYLPLHTEDVIMVSAWWDAHVAAQLPLPNKFVYLIQDYEPIFYNNGDQQMFAEQTYTSGKFIPLCNTELLHRFMGESGYSYIEKEGLWFEPAVAKKPVLEKDTNKTTKRLFLYGRPSVHRNMFYTAVQAIDRALQQPQMREFKWELYSAGQADLPNIALSSGHVIKNMGKMDLESYYAFAQDIDITLSPMLAPHPNYPTLELASLGSVVVTTKYKTKQSLSNYSKNILLADPYVEDMAEKICQAALVKDGLRLENHKQNNIGDDWLKNLDLALTELSKRLLSIKK